jgi:hypothetical protein
LRIEASVVQLCLILFPAVGRGGIDLANMAVNLKNSRQIDLCCMRRFDDDGEFMGGSIPEMLSGGAQ